MAARQTGAFRSVVRAACSAARNRAASAGFLAIYFVVLWLALRWNTQRMVARLLARWRAADYPDPALNLATQTLQWIDLLVAPIRQARERMKSLADRAETLRKQEASGSKAA